MPAKVKICGVRTPAIVETAAEAGADYVGFVFFEKSPRYLTLAAAKALARAARGRIGTVAVLVDPDDALIDRVVETVRPDLLQLHGSETPERVAAIKARAKLPVMKAVAVASVADVAAARAFAASADHILFDAKAGALRAASGRQRCRLRLARASGLSGALRSVGRPDPRHGRRSHRRDRGSSGRCVIGRRA